MKDEVKKYLQKSYPEYFPKHSENKMDYEGDVELARSRYIADKPSNLSYLLFKRFNWMNDYLKTNQKIIEIGSGAGFSSFFLKQKIILSDVIKRDYIDLQIDAMNLKLENNSVDVFICSHVIHHVAKPIIFLNNLESIPVFFCG